MDYVNERSCPMEYHFNDTSSTLHTINMDSTTIDPSQLHTGTTSQAEQPPGLYNASTGTLGPSEDMPLFNMDTNELQPQDAPEFDWGFEPQHNFATSNAGTVDSGVDTRDYAYDPRQPSNHFPNQYSAQYNGPHQSFPPCYHHASHLIQTPQVPHHTIMTANDSSGDNSASSYRTAPESHFFFADASNPDFGTLPPDVQQAFRDFYHLDNGVSRDDEGVPPPLDDGNPPTALHSEEIGSFQNGVDSRLAGVPIAAMTTHQPSDTMPENSYLSGNQNAPPLGPAPTAPMASIQFTGQHTSNQYGQGITHDPSNGGSLSNASHGTERRSTTTGQYGFQEAALRPDEFNSPSYGVGQASAVCHRQEFGPGGIIPVGSNNMEGRCPLPPSSYPTTMQNRSREGPLTLPEDRGVYRPGYGVPCLARRLQPDLRNAAQLNLLQQQPPPPQTSAGPAGKKRKAAKAKSSSRKRARVAAHEDGDGKPASKDGRDGPMCIACVQKAPIPGEPRCKRCKRSHERATAPLPELPYRRHTWDETYKAMFPDFPGIDGDLLRQNPGLAQEREDQQEQWVQRFLASAARAFNRNNRNCPIQTVQENDLYYFEKQQETLNGNCLMESFPRVEEGKDRYELETISMRMRMLFRTVLHFHHGGICIYPPDGDNRGYGAPERFSFDQRLHRLAEMMEWDKRIVIDVIEARGVRAFALSPKAFWQRKKSNASSNFKKKQTQDASDKAAPVQDAVEDEVGDEDADQRSNASGEEEGEEQGADEEPPANQTGGLALPRRGKRRR